MGINITFCGAGFLGIYHIGVVSCLKSHSKKLLDEISCFGGCSAGALAACMLICDVDLEACVQFVMNQASKVHKNLLGPLSKDFDICNHIRKSCAKYLPADAYRRASGKLFISLTRVADFENVIVSEYESNKDLIDALICTCFIPVFSGMIPPKFKGVAYIDGVMSDNLPQHFEGTTITVSPFGGENDICPNDRHKSSSQFDLQNTNIQFSCHNLYRMTRALFPPDDDVLIKMCQEGFSDALKYLYINYPEYLSFDMSFQFSLPQCCQATSMQQGNGKAEMPNVPNQTVPFADSTIEDGKRVFVSSESDYFSEMEQKIVTEKMLKSLVAPKELNEALLKTKVLLEEEKLNWFFIQILFTLGSWSRKPCSYTSACFFDISKRMLKTLLPKVQVIGSYNYYTQRLMNLAVKGFHSYKETALFEWHPSIKEEDQISHRRSRARLQSVEESLIAVPQPRVEKKPVASRRKKVRFLETITDGYETDYEYDDADGDDFTTTIDSVTTKAIDSVVCFNAVVDNLPNALETKSESFMSFEEDSLLNFEDKNGSESTSLISSATASMKSVVSNGFAYIYSKSLSFK